MKKPLKILAGVFGGRGAIAVAGVVFWSTSPWPGVWAIRAVPDEYTQRNVGIAAEFVPTDIRARIDLVYDKSSPQGVLDVFAPADAEAPLPTIFWVHGGGFIAGTKTPVQNYLKILSSHGFTIVNVEYTHAPEATYPTPLRQVDAAIAYSLAHIAAQTAMAIAQPNYAEAAGIPVSLAPEQLVGSVQYSGPYDPTAVDYDNATFGFYMRTVMWAYSGTKHFLDDPQFLFTALPEHVDAPYPPTFVSTGPTDPLLHQNEQ